MFRVLFRDPKAGTEMGNSILLRVLMSSVWRVSAVSRAA